jgi:hypothetical protein
MGRAGKADGRGGRRPLLGSQRLSERQLTTADPADHVCDGERVQVSPHMVAHLRPHGQQRALALVVAGPAHVRLTKVADDDGPIDGGDDLAEREIFRRTGQHVTATDTTLGPHQSGTLQGEQDLFEVGLGETGAFGDVTDRSGLVAAMQRQGQQSTTSVVTSCRNSHKNNLLRTGPRYRGLGLCFRCSS